MSFQHPLQRIEYLRTSSRNFLVGAAGPKLFVFGADNGAQLDVWPSNSQSQQPPIESTIDQPSTHEGTASPPGKRRKLSQTVEEGDGNRGTQISSTSCAWTVIPLLIASPTGGYIVALTGEDKCIRVFQVDANGCLSQLSERCMPKRPWSITFDQEYSTIICGDKFGDVYSLPLLPSDDVKPPTKKNPPAAKPYKPSASKLTVHTKKNLISLEQQLRSTSMKPEKTGPLFEYSLLLGHVSMLTDIAHVVLPNSRSYILTADRDEHIRVSRGPPQAHIIHGYCLGHTSFVSKLCVPRWAPELLISGGGDDHVIIWDWIEGQIIHRLPLQLNSRKSDIAVSGIWALALEGNLDIPQDTKGAILISTEGSQEILPFIITSDNQVTRLPTIQAAGYVLDVAMLDDQGNIVISVDNINAPGSINIQRSDLPTSPLKLLQRFAIAGHGGEIKWEEKPDGTLDSINNRGTFEVTVPGDETEAKVQMKKLTDALYNIGNLRKRAGGDDDD
ncbi:tRNA (guanine-N(7)-)-methyltransferase non-catalytic subunit trm82 [Myotisia sp. PD_48]|nr:tRNA (guanine-N(7)-)-methyltransferase non-catalytic subunit trm82 [Myotisia sp. PD_48]